MLMCVDASIWVGAYFVNEKQHELAYEFYNGVLAGKHNVVGPASVLVETVCSIERGLRDLKLTALAHYE